MGYKMKGFSGFKSSPAKVSDEDIVKGEKKLAQQYNKFQEELDAIDTGFTKVGKDGNAVDTAQWKQGGNGETISASSDWIVKRYIFQTPLIIESVEFEFSGTGKIKINDFSAEYRPLRKRAD